MQTVISSFRTSDISIVFDKCAYQSIGKSEMERLSRYFVIVVPPIMVREILGDLKKDTGEGEINAKTVIDLSGKLPVMDTCFNANYQKLIHYELSGGKITWLSSMVDTGKLVDMGGEKGIIVKKSVDAKAMDRWKQGEFTQHDELHSELWRELTLDPDTITELQKHLKAANPQYNKLTDPALVLNLVKQVLNNPVYHLENLKAIIENFNVPQQLASQVFYQWEILKPKGLFEFAEYSTYCLMLKMYFSICLQNNIVGTRATNFLDLEYLYYLPFCRVFVSDDKFHKKLVPHLLIHPQRFVTGQELKADIKKIEEIIPTLTGKDLQRTWKEPPRVEDLLCYKLWKANFENWPREKDWEPSEWEKQMFQDKISKMRQSGAFDDLDEYK